MLKIRKEFKGFMDNLRAKDKGEKVSITLIKTPDIEADKLPERGELLERRTPVEDDEY